MIPFSLTDVDYPFNLYCSPDWSAETLQRLLHILGMRHWKTSISINNKGVLSNKKKIGLGVFNGWSGCKPHPSLCVVCTKKLRRSL